MIKISKTFFWVSIFLSYFTYLYQVLDLYMLITFIRNVSK